MTEIEQVKTFWKRSSGEVITFTEGTLMDIIQLARKDILSLLTTIESQNSQIESLKAITELAVKSLEEIFQESNDIINLGSSQIVEERLAQNVIKENFHRGRVATARHLNAWLSQSISEISKINTASVLTD